MTHYLYAALYTITVFVECSNCTSVSNGSFVDMNGQPVGKDTSVDGPITHSVNQTAESQNSYMGYGQAYPPVYQEHDQSLMQTGSYDMLYCSNIGSGHNTGVGLPSSYLSPKSNKQSNQCSHSMQPVATSENGIPSHQTTSAHSNPNTETSSYNRSMDYDVTYASHSQNLSMQRPENTELPYTQNQTDDTLQAYEIEQIIAEILEFHKKRCLEIPSASNFAQEISNSVSIAQQTYANCSSRDLELGLPTTSEIIGQASAGQTYLASSLATKRPIGVDQQDNNHTKKPKLSQATIRSDMGNGTLATINICTNMKRNQTQAETLGDSREKTQAARDSYITDLKQRFKKFEIRFNIHDFTVFCNNSERILLSRILNESELSHNSIAQKLYMVYVITLIDYNKRKTVINEIINKSKQAGIQIINPKQKKTLDTDIFKEAVESIPKFENLKKLAADLEIEFCIFCKKSKSLNIKDMRLLFVQFLLAYVLEKKDNEQYSLKPNLWKLQMYMVEIRPYFNWRLSMIQDPINQANLSCHDYAKEIELLKNLLIDYYSDYPAGEKYKKSLQNMGSVYKYRQYILDLLSTDQYKETAEFLCYQNAFSYKKGFRTLSVTIKCNFMYMLSFTSVNKGYRNFYLRKSLEKELKEQEKKEKEDEQGDMRLWTYIVTETRKYPNDNKEMFKMFLQIENESKKLIGGNVSSSEELVVFTTFSTGIYTIRPKFGDDHIEITDNTWYEMIIHFHNIVYRVYMS